VNGEQVAPMAVLRLAELPTRESLVEQLLRAAGIRLPLVTAAAAGGCPFRGATGPPGMPPLPDREPAERR
jgi:hypothetical protein